MKRYQIVGYNQDGESRYWKRNVAEDSAQDEMNEARAEGWSRMQAVPESF